jgi:hypothetical protein
LKVFNALANDVAPDSLISFTKTSDPISGSTSLNGSVVTYTLNLDYFGQNSLAYVISDSPGDSDTATVFLNVLEASNNNGIANSVEVSAHAKNRCVEFVLKQL